MPDTIAFGGNVMNELGKEVNELGKVVNSDGTKAHGPGTHKCKQRLNDPKPQSIGPIGIKIVYNYDGIGLKYEKHIESKYKNKSYKYAKTVEKIQDKTVGGAGLPGPCAVAEENIKKTENSKIQDKTVRVSGLPDACAVAEENTEKTENSKYIEKPKKADYKAELTNENIGGHDVRESTGNPKAMKTLATEMIAMFTEVRQTGDGNVMALGRSEWEPLVSIIDSGCTVPVAPLSVGRGYPVIEGRAKQAGVCYAQADGTELPNLGEKALAVVTQEGTLRGYTTQLADVTHALQSVRALMKSGHFVGFDDEGSWIVNKVSGEYNKIEDDGINFLMKQWIVPHDKVGLAMEAVAAAHADGGFHRQAS